MMNSTSKYKITQCFRKMLLLVFKFHFLSAWVWYNLYAISLFLPVVSIRFVAKLLKERCLVCFISHIALKWFMP